MRPIWVHHSEPGYRSLLSFMTQRIWGDDRDMMAGTIMAVVDEDAVKAVVLFHNYEPEAGVIEVSAASDSKRWLTRPILWEMFSYAFGEVGCQAVVARIDPDNTSLARIFTAYGFTRHDIPRLRGRDKADCVLVLTDDAWAANGFHKEHGRHGKGTEADKP